MIIVMKNNAEKEQVEKVKARIIELGYTPHVIHGETREVIGAIGDGRGKEVLNALEALPGVENVVPILKPYKLASKEIKTKPSCFEISPGVTIGGGKLLTIAGPCSVESEEQLISTAIAVKAAGANALRGGAFKPRTSPYAFQGMELEGLKILAAARQETGLPIVTEVVNPRDVELVAKYADIMQVGARNTQNFPLLKMLGQLGKPVLLKRGMATTIQEFLMSAEYILSEGNQRVILCERGIRTFETATRNTLDISAIPVLKSQTHLPVIIDPSHSTGHSHLVPSMCYASIAAGADGLIVEVHSNPAEALCDGPQSLNPEEFAIMMKKATAFAEVADRSM